MPGPEPGPGLRGRELSAVAPRRNERKCERERGVALVIVLFTLVAIALVVSVFSRTTFTGRRVVANEAAHARAHAMLAAGLNRAIVGLADPVRDRRWQPDGSVHDFAFAGGTVALSIADEGGKIDLNAAPAAVLKSLLAEFGAAEREADGDRGGDRAPALGRRSRGHDERDAQSLPQHRRAARDRRRLRAALRRARTLRHRLFGQAYGPSRNAAGRGRWQPSSASTGPDLVQDMASGTTAALNDAREIMQHLPAPTRRLSGDVGPFYTVSVEARTDDGAAAAADFVIWQARSAYSVIERRDRTL